LGDLLDLLLGMPTCIPSARSQGIYRGMFYSEFRLGHRPLRLGASANHWLQLS
jgi:hypothetical protein